ncbi:MAG TPA: phosphatase PAP2 family protein [Mycobacteriales bacterium]|nr:phosphatase PAP2 family protein [Mycobacteriales bacterium]
MSALFAAAALPRFSGDRHDFRVVNDFARDTSWLHGFMKFWAQDGIFLLALALLVAWWLGRRANSPRKVATAVWGALAALVAVALVQPIANAVDERRPFVTMPHVLTLIHHANDVGFPSDHATAAGAVAVTLLFVSWELGLVTVLAAFLIAFSRIYVGVHFPQDVGAGLVLGALVALIGLAVLVPLLTRIAERLTRTPLRPLLVSNRAVSSPG